MSVLTPVSFDTQSTIKSLKGLAEVSKYVKEHPKIDHKEYGSLFNAMFGAVRADEYGIPLLSTSNFARACLKYHPELSPLYGFLIPDLSQ